MAYTTCSVPAGGKISIQNGKLNVPDQPRIPFIRGDGTGPDIWAASVRVMDAAVAKAYGGQRKISWMEVFAGEESFKRFNNWLPDDTVEAFREFLVGIKGPLTTPVGGGIRSLNVALRQLFAQLLDGFNTRGVDPIDGLRKQAHVLNVGQVAQLFSDVFFKAAGSCKVEFGIHAQCKNLCGQGWQLPKVAITQTAICVQSDLNDAGMQAGVQEVTQAHQNPRQNTPVNARRAEQGDGKGQASRRGFNA